jgi:hypothetical protein
MGQAITLPVKRIDRLAIAGLPFLILGIILCVWSRNASAWIAGADWIGYAFMLTRFIALVTQIWLAGFAALAAAPLMAPKGEAWLDIRGQDRSDGGRETLRRGESGR